MVRTPHEEIRVLIADDHPMVREGLRSMLKTPDIRVVGEASTGLEAVALGTELRPDIVLMDVRMPDLDGLEAVARIKREASDVHVLMVSTYENPDYLLRAIAAGAAGYVLKGISRSDLIEAIRTVYRGESLVNKMWMKEMLRKVVDGDEREDSRDREKLEALSKRELEVLRLVAKGLSNREIAELLFISTSTVKTHVEHIIGKLGMSDRTQVAVWAVRNGLA